MENGKKNNDFERMCNDPEFWDNDGCIEGKELNPEMKSFEDELFGNDDQEGKN